MAKTKRGQKYNRIDAYPRVMNGVEYQVRAHRRSNPRSSSGAVKSKPKSAR